MKEQEYNERLKKIESDYEQAKRLLYIEYGKSQAKFDVGDIISDETVTIKVDKITVYKSFGFPEPVYNGVELKKDLTPKKNRNKSAIYGSHKITLIEKFNQPNQ